MDATTPLDAITPTYEEAAQAQDDARTAWNTLQAQDPESPQREELWRDYETRRRHSVDLWDRRADAARALIRLEDYTGPRRRLVTPLREAMSLLAMGERISGTAPRPTVGYEVIEWEVRKGETDYQTIATTANGRMPGTTVANIAANGTVTLTHCPSC